LLNIKFIKSVSFIFLLLFHKISYSSEFVLTSEMNIVGEVAQYLAKEDDTFVKIARAYNLGFNELKMANPEVNPWLPGEGSLILLPTKFILPNSIKREGIVINLPELRLYYFPEDRPNILVTHPISIGRMEWGTPIANTSIFSKSENPTWYPPQSIIEERQSQNRPINSVVPPGPDNPLGSHALRLTLPGYLIHGTNMPAGVGMRVTHGCIRMFPEDIEDLYFDVPNGTLVQIINQPFKIGNIGEQYFLEAHPPLEDTMDNFGSIMTELTKSYVSFFEKGMLDFNWDYAEKIAVNSNGIPVIIN
tara:strand:- start:283 stop:1194 length:912 start_codon:yes stop_codon:yes gene_type:complete